MLSIVLVVLVIFVFLRSWRATLIPAVALPLSLIGTFGVMALLRLRARQPVADGADRRDRLRGGRRDRHDRERGALHRGGRSRRWQAAYRGAAQIGFTIVSLTVSLIAVFIPLLFMTGVVGRLFSEFAVTLSVAVVVSAVVSLTLTPMMCGRLLRAADAERPWLFARLADAGFHRLLAGYRRTRCAGRCGARR